MKLYLINDTNNFFPKFRNRLNHLDSAFQIIPNKSVKQYDFGGQLAPPFLEIIYVFLESTLPGNFFFMNHLFIHSKNPCNLYHLHFNTNLWTILFLFSEEFRNVIIQFDSTLTKSVCWNIIIFYWKVCWFFWVTINFIFSKNEEVLIEKYTIQVE